MKKALKIISIALIIAGILSLLMAALFRWAYYHLMDGSNEQYARLRYNKTVCLVTGIVLTAVGTACLLIRRKL